MNENLKTANNNIITMVVVSQTPISERYCNVGDIAMLDVKNNKIRCGDAWFNFDDRWIVESCNN